MSPTSTWAAHAARLGRALRWALVTGRDRDLAPPLVLWRIPAVVRWTLVLVGLAGFTLISLNTWTKLTGSFGFLITSLQLVPPLLSRARPLTAVRIAFLTTAVAMTAIYPYGQVPLRPDEVLVRWPLDTFFMPFLPVLALAIARSPRGNGLGIAAGTLALAAAVGVVQRPRATITGVLMDLVVAGVAVTIGFLLNRQQESKVEADTATRQAVDERDKRVALLERTRIARELHDVIGHHLTMIAVRTDSAQYRLPQLDEAAKQEMAALGAAAREALDETRQLLGLLREDNSEAERAPQPRTDDIGRLIHQAREAGMSVELDIDGQFPRVRSAVGIAAYRIVQEGLSNAQRHSPGAAVLVRFDFRPADFEIEISNGPPAGPVPAAAAGGTGLIGIRERVAMFGGDCELGPRSDGGYRVWTRLPMPQSPTTEGQP